MPIGCIRVARKSLIDESLFDVPKELCVPSAEGRKSRGIDYAHQKGGQPKEEKDE